jgi:hypothetical protein
MSGRIDASTTRSAWTLPTSPQASTTAVASEPALIGAVDVGCGYAPTVETMFARRASPSSTAGHGQTTAIVCRLTRDHLFSLPMQ